MNIFVGNLPFRMRGHDLEQLFSPYGEVTAARVITDKATKKSKGFGFVEMADADAEKAIAELNGSDVQGRNIVVSVAKERENSER